MSIMYLHKSWHCPPNKSIMQNIVSTIVKADTLVRLTELKKNFYILLNPHFWDALPSQSFGIVLKKLNLTQQKQTTQEQNSLS